MCEIFFNFNKYKDWILIISKFNEEGLKAFKKKLKYK